MKKIIAGALCAIFALGAMDAQAQSQLQGLKVIKPSNVEKRDFAKENQKFQSDLKRLKDLQSQDKEIPEELQYFFDCGGSDDPYMTDHPDCDGWYIAGGPSKVEASSSLKPQGKYTYEAKCAHDFTMALPWCEGVEGNGIGEWLLYKMNPPRVTNIYIANGFVLNSATYANNARAKRLRLDFNGTPKAILELDDVLGIQTFDIESAIGELGNGKDNYEIKFTVLDAYNGSKYQDLCISEIWFSGKDVLCFAEGTMVTMSNGSKKPIEQIRKGHEILCFQGQALATARVEEVAEAIHGSFVEYTLDNGISVTCTPDHPIMCASKGWVSQDPAKTAASYKGYANCKKAEIGDMIVTSSGHSAITAIKPIQETKKSYEFILLTQKAAIETDAAKKNDIR